MSIGTVQTPFKPVLTKTYNFKKWCRHFVAPFNIFVPFSKGFTLCWCFRHFVASQKIKWIKKLQLKNGAELRLR